MTVRKSFFLVALKTQGLNGIIEDGSQRSYFPTGFQFYVYGETLFDRNVTFEELRDDYFSHAFGENWKAVVEYLETLRDNMRYSYFFGLESKDETRGVYYNPEMQENAKRAAEAVKAFIPTIKENLYQEQRASAVAWQILELHTIYALAIAEMTVHKCVGEDEQADEILAAAIKKLSEREIYFERYYDHYLCARRMRGFMKDKSVVDNLSV